MIDGTHISEAQWQSVQPVKWLVAETIEIEELSLTSGGRLWIENVGDVYGDWELFLGI